MALVIMVNIFIIIVYMSDIYISFEPIYVVDLILLAFFTFRNGAAVTYYSIQLGERTGGTQLEEAAGSLYSYIILVGLSGGSYVSLALASVKTKFLTK